LPARHYVEFLSEQIGAEIGWCPLAERSDRHRQRIRIGPLAGHDRRGYRGDSTVARIIL
jgi:hypothetical protein